MNLNQMNQVEQKRGILKIGFLALFMTSNASQTVS
jgi:hypothetical protein